MNFQNLFLGLTTSTIAQDHPINYFDIGSRGGFQEDLLPLAFAVNAIGFEPEPSEFIKLDSQESGPWLTSKHLPFAISGDGGRQTLFISRDPQSASLLQHNMELGVRFDKTQFVEVEAKIEIETQTLSEALELANINSIDYLKIDIEGAELEVFRSSPTIMDNILAVKTEVSFVEFRHDQPHAFEVEEFMNVLKYSHVQHIESTVTGELDSEYTSFDATRATFPAGTLSGAPKIRAMEIIDELESTSRGVYGGGIGYYSWDGNADFAIVIRTATIKLGEVDTITIQAGAGIVADSVPAKEYEETEKKMHAVLESVYRLADRGQDK